MKNKEEICREAEEMFWKRNGRDFEEHEITQIEKGEYIGVYLGGYTQCQKEDMAKELIEWIEITLSESKLGASDTVIEALLNVKYKIESLNKQERKEIQPNDIWNKESQDKIKEHILNLSKKQTPKDILETELMAKKYTEEDIRKAILLSATSDTDFIPDRCDEIINSLNKQDNEK